MARQTGEAAIGFRIFFLYIEPFFSFLGAYAAFFQPEMYLRLTHGPTAPKYGIPTSTQVILNQLANLYLYFSINEALILRATSDLRVWRTLVIVLLIADFGHLYSIHPIGTKIYWDVGNWNALDWGNLGFVYLGALTRISFLLYPKGFPTRLRSWRKSPSTPRRSTRRIKPTPKAKE